MLRFRSVHSDIRLDPIDIASFEARADGSVRFSPSARTRGTRDRERRRAGPGGVDASDPNALGHTPHAP